MKYFGTICIILLSYIKSTAQLSYSITTSSATWIVPIPTITTAGNNYSTTTINSSVVQTLLTVELFVLLGATGVSVYKQDTGN